MPSRGQNIRENLLLALDTLRTHKFRAFLTILGVLLALLISKIVDAFFTSSVPLSAIVVGLVLSMAVGLFFGIYPASKAAKLDPIEALRTEA
jgi:ABC-type antimicrobial peptide transport system permease subunit